MIYLITFLALAILMFAVLFIQHLADRSKVRAIILWKSRKVSIHKVKPVDDYITIKGYTYNLDEDNFTEYKGMRTYIFEQDNAQALNPFDTSPSKPSPKKLTTGIKNNLMSQLMHASNKGFSMDMNLSTVLLFVLLGALGVLGYLGHSIISDMQADIDIIKAWVDSFGGVNNG